MFDSILIKGLSIITLLLFVLSLVLFILYQSSQNELSLNIQQYKSLQGGYKDLSDSYSKSLASRVSDERIVDEQQTNIVVIDKEKESLKEQLRKYAKTSCNPSKDTSTRVEVNEKPYVDVNGEFSPDYLRLFDSLGKD